MQYIYIIIYSTTFRLFGKVLLKKRKLEEKKWIHAVIVERKLLPE